MGSLRLRRSSLVSLKAGVAGSFIAAEIPERVDLVIDATGVGDNFEVTEADVDASDRTLSSEIEVSVTIL